MRVLIITHPRSGGFSLTLWLSKELGCNFYHEPFNVESKNEIDFNVFVDKNCVVKIFPYEFQKFDIDFKNFIDTFDKIIIHERDNDMDIAVSLAWTVLNNKNPEDWHETYETNEKWFDENKTLIESKLNDVKYFKIDIEKLKNKDFLKTTYDEIFENKNDVQKILDYIGHKNTPKWLDYLDGKRKLRNGTIGMNNIKIKKEII